MKRHVNPILATLLILAALLAGLPASRPAAGESARQASSEWTIQEQTFESQYPHGFTFRLRAFSSGGAIVRARLRWYRASFRPTDVRIVNGIEGAIDPATGEITASWQPNEAVMLPPWALLQYHWELKDAAGGTFQTDPVQVEYADQTRPWTRSESEDATVLSSDLGGDIEGMVLDALAQQHDQYLAVWGAALPYRPRIVLFGDIEAWLEWRTADTISGEHGYVVGQTFDEWGVIAQVLSGVSLDAAARELAYSTVVHETEHLYQAEFLAARKRYDLPRWFYEGDATFFELEQSYDYLGRVRQQAADGDLPLLLTPNPADAPGSQEQSGREAYDIGYSFFAWLQMKSGGLQMHHDLMVLLAQNVPFFDALEQVTGMTVPEIERDWRVWLGASPEPPALIPTWTPPPLPAIATPNPGGK